MSKTFLGVQVPSKEICQIFVYFFLIFGIIIPSNILFKKIVFFAFIKFFGWHCTQMRDKKHQIINIYISYLRNGYKVIVPVEVNFCFFGFVIFVGSCYDHKRPGGQ